MQTLPDLDDPAAAEAAILPELEQWVGSSRTGTRRWAHRVAVLVGVRTHLLLVDRCRRLELLLREDLAGSDDRYADGLAQISAAAGARIDRDEQLLDRLEAICDRLERALDGADGTART